MMQLQKRKQKQITIESRYLLIVAFVFIFIPTKPDVQGLIGKLAAKNLATAGQWAVVIFLSIIPLIILAIPAFRIAREEIKDIKTNGLKTSWKSTSLLAGSMLLLAGFCAVRVLHWTS